MSKQISVLIADDNIEYGNLLQEYISQYEDICVKGIARDGLETIERIKELSPDVVILDIIMPNLDGIGVLEKVNEIKMQPRPMFVVLSAIGQDVFVHRAISLGAEYYIVKPFDVDILVSRVRQVYKEKPAMPFACSKERLKAPDLNAVEATPASNTVEVEVTGLMHVIGIPPHMAGYQYLREAVMMTIEGSSLFNSVTKVIYPDIARKNKTTARKVERAIRCAIDSAWAKGHLTRAGSSHEALNGLGRKKPTNSQLISTLADKVRLKMNVKQK